MEQKIPISEEPFLVFGLLHPVEFKDILIKLLLGLLEGDREANNELDFPDFLQDFRRIITYLDGPFGKDQNEILRIISAAKIQSVVYRCLIGYIRSVRFELPAEFQKIYTVLLCILDSLLYLA